MLTASASPGRARLLPHLASVLVSVVVFALIYDPFHAGAVAFIALAPIVLVFSNPAVECSLGRAALCGFAFGLLAAMAIVGPWMFTAASDYFDHGAMWSFGFTLAVNATFVALFYVPVFMILRVLASAPPLLRVLGAASTWIAFEALRAWSPAGNSWALLGQGLVNVPLLREAAAFGGTWMLGAMAALCGAAAGVGLQPDIRPGDAQRCTLLALLAPLTLAGLGLAARGASEKPAPLPNLRVAVVQQEVAGRDVWDPARRMENWQEYLATTETIPPGSVDLVLWPENAVPFLLDTDADALQRIRQLAKNLDAAILLGASRSSATSDGHAAIHNSAFFFPPGAPPIPYDKRRLLPFIESPPPLLEGDANGGLYVPGQSETLFDLKGWRIAPLLCFEAVYPEYAAEAVAHGASLLVNLSNDAWFAGGSGPEQHWAMSIGRSVEVRRPMVRAANGGVSGAVAADGSLIGYPLRRQKAVRIYEVPPPPRMTTQATTGGTFVPKVAAAIALLALASALANLVRLQKTD